MKKVCFYIGADNASGSRQSEVIFSVLNLFFEGWTSVGTVGAWKGSSELASLVVVFTEKDEAYIRECAGALKYHLRQQEIGLTIEKTEFELI